MLVQRHNLPVLRCTSPGHGFISCGLRLSDLRCLCLKLIFGLGRQTAALSHRGRRGRQRGLCDWLGGNQCLFPNTQSDDKFQRSCNCYNLELSGNQTACTMSPLYVLVYPPGRPTGDSLNAAIERQRQQEQGRLLALKLSLILLKAICVSIRSAWHCKHGVVVPLLLCQSVLSPCRWAPPGWQGPACAPCCGWHTAHGSGPHQVRLT